MSTTIHVTAERWEKGWDLILDEDNATSVTHLKDAEQQVRDYLDTIEPAIDHSDVDIDLTVDLGGLQDDIAIARKETLEAARQQERAAAQLRKAARSLKSRNIPAADAAVLLEVSKGRVYQLLAPAQKTHS